MRLLRTVCTLALATIASIAGSQALAGVPDPASSTVDPCIRVCPSGDMNFHVVVRDFASNPVAGSSVLINFSSCFGVTFCPPLPTDPYTFVPPSSIQMLTNAAGVADFPIRAGGLCVGLVQVFADGVLLANRGSVASPDQNGDLNVNAVDSGLMAAKLGGPYDPTADLNCSGSLEIGDPDVLNGHLSHMCSVVVSVMPRTWGSIKMIYR